MPLILVVEQDEGTVSHLRRTFERDDDWRVRHVRSVDEAMHSVSSEAPDLIVASTGLAAAGSVLGPFARRQGGPGTLALIPQEAAPPADRLAEAGHGADAVLVKPVTGDQVRDAVRRILKVAEKPAAAPEPDEPKLTSHDIFGDLVAEVELEEAERTATGSSAEPASRPTPEPPAEPAPEPPAGTPPSRRPAKPRPRVDDDIERRLEQTLSGVLSPTPRKGGAGKSTHGDRRKPSAQAPPPDRSPERSPGPPDSRPRSPQKSRPKARDPAAEVDDLLSKTLSGLDISRRKRPAAPPAPGPRSEPPASPPEPETPAPAETADDAPTGAPPASRETAPERPRESASEPPWTLDPEPKSEPRKPTTESIADEFEQAFRAAEADTEDASPFQVESQAESQAKAGTGPGTEPRPEAGPPPEAEPPEPAADRDAATDQAAAAPPSAPPGPSPPGSKSVPFEPELAEAFEEAPESLDEPADEPAAEVGAPPGPTGADEPPEAPAPAGVEAPAPGGSGEGGQGVAFGQYRLLDRIGVGGMAEVWKARMTGVEGFQKTVAIKKILAHLTDSSDFVDMFIDEAKLAAQLNHANIIHIYDLGKIDGDYYIAMEYVEGENLRAILNAARKEGRPLPVGLALFIAAKLASALDYAHRKRDFEDRSLDLVHRDVSPQNVLVGYEGTIKLCDFGIVKAVSKSSHTRMGALKGKLQYMSPEQAWGRPVDSRSDIFSLGSLLFEMLTGRRLFSGDSEMEVLEAVRECRVRAPGDLDPSVPDEVDAVALRALAKEPIERYQSAGEMGRRLEEILMSMRPSPGSGELSAYMRELFESVELAPAAAGEADRPDRPEGGNEPFDLSAPSAPSTPPAEEIRIDESMPELPEISPPAQGKPPETAPESAPATGSPPAGSIGPTGPVGPASRAGDQTLEPAPAGDTSHGAAPPEARPIEPVGPAEPIPPVEAVEPVGRVEPEEGGGRGKGVLILAILAALAVAVAALLYWWFLARPQGTAGEPGDAPREEAPAGTEPAQPDVSPEAPSAVSSAVSSDQGSLAPGGAFPDEGGAEGEASAATPADAPPGGEPGSAEGVEALVEQTLEDKLAREEEQLRREYEQKERELSERLADAQRRAERQPGSESGPEPDPAPAPEAPPSSRPDPEPTPERASQPPAAGVADPGATRPGGGDESAPATARTEGDRAVNPGSRPDGATGAATGAGATGRETRAPDAKPAAASDPGPAPESGPEPEPRRPTVRTGELVEPGPGVIPPQLVTFAKPEYPPVARRLRVEGTVVVSVLVDENGDVIESRLDQRVRQKVGINEAAQEAARRAKYRPATKDGVRVKMWTTLKIPFRL
ncbi:MAG: TonB family protein [Acidobacteriota bacterium]|jgi:TonB family protein